MVSSIAMLHKQFDLTSIICLHTVKVFYSIDGTLTGTTSDQSVPKSNGNERSTPDLEHCRLTIKTLVVGGSHSFAEIEVAIFRSPSRLGFKRFLVTF